MEVASVVAAAIAGYVLGALWYMVLGKPWMAAAGIEAGEDGRPKQGMGAMTYLLAFIAMLLVAGMIRHVLAQAGIVSPAKAGLAGLGLGLFVASPWIMLNNAFGGRPFRLTLIDGGYASLGCGLIAVVVALI